MSDIKISPKHGVNPTIPVCFWCGKDKDEIALMGKIDKEDSEAPRRLIMNYDPCDKCKALFSRGIQVIGASNSPIVPSMFPIVDDGTIKLYPTGSMFVATEDWAQRFLTANHQEHMIEQVLTKKMLIMPESVVSEIVKESKSPEMEVSFPEEVSDENN
jgi:hypothetical protein